MEGMGVELVVVVGVLGEVVETVGVVVRMLGGAAQASGGC